MVNQQEHISCCRRGYKSTTFASKFSFFFTSINGCPFLLLFFSPLQSQLLNDLIIILLLTHFLSSCGSVFTAFFGHYFSRFSQVFESLNNILIRFQKSSLIFKKVGIITSPKKKEGKNFKGKVISSKWYAEYSTKSR